MALTAEEMLAEWDYFHPSLKDTHEGGVTEPWVANLIRGLLLARGGHPTVLETGSFRGITSAWIALTLEQMGGGQLWACDLEAERAQGVMARLDALDLKRCQYGVLTGDVLRYIDDAKPQTFDLVFIDDDHQKHHVAQEIVGLWPKMKAGGVMCLHDVHGVCDLQSVVAKFGGISLHMPRLGPAGGLGLIQLPL